MTILAAQFLESVPENLTPAQARECLKRAFAILPLTHILLGWEVPPNMEAAVAEEATRNNAQLYQWHPLLTGEKDTPTAWHTVNLHGKPIPGHKDLPEFTFLCPNHPDVQSFVVARVEKVIRRGIYHGLFLDRIRFPSPTASPEKFLGCFCDECRQSAEQSGFDLEQVRSQISELLTQDDGRIILTRSLFDHYPESDSTLELFLRFRADSITRTVTKISKQLTASDMDTVLDCFSPSLAWMVAQDLGTLNNVSTWIKIMTYPHTFGPAGLPFELLGLLDWLNEYNTGNGLDILRKACALDLPQTREILATVGLHPETIQKEIELGHSMGIRTLLAGLALVDLPSINVVDTADILASQFADGLVLSWDLWHIAPKHLKTIFHFIK
jgi:hypothetical protein